MIDVLDRAALVAAEQLQVDLPRRWTHVRAVAETASEVSHVVPSDDRVLLIAAAWLHDIGYTPSIAETGFHALDGARWLLSAGFPQRLASLVAYHSCASYEAEVRGLADVLCGEFEQEQSLTADALWFADMTTGPDGQKMTVIERLAEIRSRYGSDHLVTKFWVPAEPVLLETIRRVEQELSDQPM